MNRGTYLLPRVLPAFQELYPDISVQFKENNSTELDKLMLSGKLDFSVMHYETPNKAIHYELLAEDDFYLVMPLALSLIHIFAEGAKENGTTVILITNNPESRLAQVADYRIITATREKLFTEEFWFSRVAAMAVMEILYLLLMAGMPTAASHVRRHEKAISADKQMEKRKE